MEFLPKKNCIRGIMPDLIVAIRGGRPGSDLDKTSGKDRRLWNSCFACTRGPCPNFYRGLAACGSGAKKRPLTTRKFEPTSERLRRGDYLVHAVMHCMGCHSKWDGKANPPVLASQEGSGQVLFEQGGFRLVAPNITSDPETGLGNWSDDAIARAVREGIAADGTALFPLMPYEHFRDLSDEDLASIVVFLRSVPAAHSNLPPNKIPFLFARLIQAVPKPVIETGCTEPDRSHARQVRRVPGRDGNMQRLPHAAQF